IISIDNVGFIIVMEVDGDSKELLAALTAHNIYINHKYILFSPLRDTKAVFQCCINNFPDAHGAI
ncbi:Hypothetical protein FKW44_003393, partial [Caligus rogercresseyi]